MDALGCTLAALSDPTRRAIVDRLARGPARVTDVAEPFAMSLAAVSKHVKVLEDAGLIARRKIGRTHLISIEAKPLEEAERWLRQWEKFWTTRLDHLQALVESDKDKKEKPND
jgi:DNA-binding transcriptional ArsR family regulator